jgi:hypothetical protein
MSQAFVREGDDMWLSDVSPSVNALLMFLTRENGAVRVYEIKTIIESSGRELHVMSNGLSYAKDVNGRWEAIQ